ncbi:MAG: UvrD-helicase domain-containing protein [Alphaproteobacteria bacterium]|nr:UvrD-helicase domain-containing protein [Alphaproteobacteria bacterium]
MNSINPAAADEESPAWVRALNEAQREAVFATEGPVLILAGAGTGKTRTLISRLRWILHCGLARPWEILAVTFTNKAASEMRTRARANWEENNDAPRDEMWRWIGTFHSLSLRMLRGFPEAAGLQKGFSILDGDDQARVIKEQAQLLKIDTSQHRPRTLLEMVQGWKDLALLPSQVGSTDQSRWLKGDLGEQLYERYQERLRDLNACDFADLIFHPVRVFQKETDILESWRSRFRYILVDEYQDINTAQYLWLRLLGGGHKNVCAVGDDDQSIYSWRGADIRNILRFPTDFPGTQTIRLEQNYRSQPRILRVAGKVISANTERAGKNLYSHLPEEEPVRVGGFWDDRAEAAFISGEAENLRRNGLAYSEAAVLVRITAQMRELEERFLADSLPYRVVGGLRFYERAEIRDALAYLRLARYSGDDLAFERVVNRPRRGIGETTLRHLRTAQNSTGGSLAEVGQRLLSGGGLRNPAARNLAAFLSSLEQWREHVESLPLLDAARRILEDSGYLAMWRTDKSFESAGRLENVESLIEGLSDFESMEVFLEHVSLVMEQWQGADEERVSLMTLHAAKGLEFDAVFLPGWEEGVFPHMRSREDKRDLEEERRLAYVGVTRARRHLYITYAASRRLHGRVEVQRPSSFLELLPESELAFLHDEAAPVVREGPPREAVKRSRAALAVRWRVGSRVRHEVFGAGEVRAQEGEWVSVHFADGEKTILSQYLTTGAGDV